MASNKQNHTLESLPTEILLAVINNLILRDIKSLRLCCERFVSLVEPTLFAKIVVAPYGLSFERLALLAHHDRLRKSVQTLTYDCRRLAIDEEPRYNPTFANMWSLSSSSRAGKASGRNMSEVLCLRRKLQLSFLGEECSRAEMAQLATSFDAFGRLKRVVVKGGHDSSLHSAEPTHFYERMVKDAQLTADNYTAYSTRQRVTHTLFYLWMSKRPISDLHLESIEWLALDRLTPLLPSLRHLHLCPQDASPQDPTIHAAYRALGHTLTHPPRPNLQALEIWFRPTKLWLESLQAHNPSFHAIVCPAYLFNSRTHYPGLRTLHIGAYWTYEHDLLAFLARAAPTLRSLSLEHVGLVAVRTEHLPLLAADPSSNVPAAWWGAGGLLRPPPSACWVGVIKFLQRELRLTRVAFRGTLVSRDQQWVCRDDVDAAAQQYKRHPMPAKSRSESETCLRARVERFIIEGGECPLNGEAVDPDSDDAGGVTTTTTTTTTTTLGAGDFSWEIVRGVGGGASNSNV